ncbi:MAG: hypothetical protein IPL43_04135 [Micropruina sp.]|nr:hypothetical protein [Micropruina sp.]
MALLDQLRSKRTEYRATADAILTRAQDEERDLSPDESRDYAAQVGEVRAVDDRIEELLAEQVRELRAATVRSDAPIENRGGVLLASEIRALTTGSPASFSPSEYAGFFIDKLAAQAVALRAGIRVIRTTRDSLVIPTWSSDTTAAWTAEGGTTQDTGSAHLEQADLSTVNLGAGTNFH